jgi:hypothetical protein
MMMMIIIISLLAIETIFWGQIIALFDLKIWFSKYERLKKERKNTTSKLWITKRILDFYKKF